MRKYIIVFGISMVGITTLKAQNHHTFDLDDDRKLVIGDIECEEIEIDDPCETKTATYTAIGCSAHRFDRTVKAPFFGPRNLGEDLQFYVKRRTADCGTPRIGNMLFKVDNVAKLFISGSNGNVGINTTDPDAQLEVNHQVTGPWSFAVKVKVSNDYTKALSVVNVKNGVEEENIILYGNGSIRSREVRVCVTQGCDYVFANDYKLMSLSDLSKFIETNKHLPDVAPAAEMEAEGINLSEMNTLLLRKIEELTLYIIGQEKQAIEQQKLIEDLQKRLSELETKKGGE